MCWGKLSRHPGRAHAWPLCGPWPRPHLAASKLVELRSSVNLVAMPHQPLDRPVASLTNPGLRDVRYAHIAPPLGCLGVAALRLPLRPALAPLARLAQPVARMLLVSVHDESHWLRWQGSLSQWHECCWCPYTTSRTGSDGKARSGKWHEEAFAWGSSPSRLCVLGRSLSHANDQESHPLPDPAAARRCGGRRPVIRC
jgi:hypothetical protein